VKKSCFIMLNLILGVLLTVPVMAQVPVPQSQESPGQGPKSSINQNQPMQRFNLKAYQGYIHNVGGQYVLTNPATNMLYKLDNQKEARAYAGRKVIVHGKLDPRTSVIHIQRIETMPQTGPSV
jgi:Protein of unknown function (DUF5818)